MDKFKILVNELYKDNPPLPLFHYTSIGNFHNIIKSRKLYASEVRYFSDSWEMKFACEIFNSLITLKLQDSNLSNKVRKGLEQFKSWLCNRLINGHLLFVASFTSNGNLLSQWRSYCKNGKEISFSFAPEGLLTHANQQSFQMGKCIYDKERQTQIVLNVINFIQQKIEETTEENDRGKRPPSESFYGIFEEIEVDLLRTAILIKSKHFSEEEEWRLISPHISNYVKAPISFREGDSFLVPYLEFGLPLSNTTGVDLELVIVGPTPNMNIAMKAVDMFLAREKARVKIGIHNCGIPYRTW
jgi:hypothetical protein